jgi:hypothetical protein
MTALLMAILGVGCPTWKPSLLSAFFGSHL